MSLEFETKNIRFLEFELNNQCQYTKIHTWCPRHVLKDTPKIELKTEIIEKVFSYFKQYNFDGTVYFSIYNEPTLDDRFIDLVKMAKKELKNCTVQAFSNGISITIEKAEEYFSAGVNVLRLSSYKQKGEYSEIVRHFRSKGLSSFIDTPDRTYAGWEGHDDRINIYKIKTNPLIMHPCYMPIQYYLVASNGDVMFCWDDWKTTNRFGNLYVNSVEETLINPLRLEYISLLKKNRSKIIPCINCERPTEMCISEYRTQLKLEEK